MAEARPAVVFGGTGGLGRAVVARLATGGAPVHVLDAHVPDEADRHPGVVYGPVDALDEADVRRALEDLGRAPAAVVNVIGGFTPGQPIDLLDLGVLCRQWELNLMTAAAITKHAVTAMKAAGTGGRIVHTSSRAAVEDGHGAFAYSVSKLAVVHLVEAAAAELRQDGITVNCILPSVIDTPGNRAAMPTADFSRWPKPEQVAAVIAFLLSDDAELVSGAALPVYGRA